MARCCGSSGSCVCKVNSGRQVEVTGTGTSQDPFIIDALTTLNVNDNDTFNVILTGDGTLDNPWLLYVEYADSAQLADLPDVSDTAPLNGQVLAWNATSLAWEPVPPTTAVAGGNLTGTGIEGDGSAGAPLEVTDDAAYFITVRGTGVGISDAGINRMIRMFADTTERAAASPVPEVGTLSVLDTDPGRVDYFTGTEWLPIDNGLRFDVQPGELLQLSGAYAGGTVIQRIAQVSATTDVNGDFDVLSALDLTDAAGVLSVSVQEMGTVGWKCMVRPDDTLGTVVGRAFRLTDGSAYSGVVVDSVVTAWLY